MDWLVSLTCGALGALASAEALPRSRYRLPVTVGLGLLGGGFCAVGLSELGQGLTHAPSGDGSLDPAALVVQAVATAGAGAVIVFALAKLRQMIRR